MLLVTLTMCLGTLFSFQAWDMFISIPVKIESYERYQAHHTIMVSDEIDFPTTQAKVDWNQWLYNAQSSRNLLGSWSLYPEKSSESGTSGGEMKVDESLLFLFTYLDLIGLRKKVLTFDEQYVIIRLSKGKRWRYGIYLSNLRDFR